MSDLNENEQRAADEFCLMMTNTFGYGIIRYCMFNLIDNNGVLEEIVKDLL